MTNLGSSALVSPGRKGRNIIVFSDGTGQRGGVFFDETRSNIYKLYRATRVAPDSIVKPQEQIAYYDAGLGTQLGGGTAVTRLWRAVYNFLSQATGLGITKNIIDCYAEIIRDYQTDDRIFLFGFSRGAYTVRCLASVICFCGIPTKDNGGPLKKDRATTQKIATRAVKSVYQHVSSPRDKQFHDQREALAKQFRNAYGSGDATPNVYPFFIGVFDTVASLLNTGSLIVIAIACGVISSIVAYGLTFLGVKPTQSLSVIATITVCALAALYVYTHLKFASKLDGFKWWETIHLTTFRQQFYDMRLNTNVGYARHAISIDERRADFPRVKWGNSKDDWPSGGTIERFQQIWFSGNHADIGGGYQENEARLSDTALSWMLEAAEGLKDEKLIVDRGVLNPHPAHDGMQHDETHSIAFQYAKKLDRDPIEDATLHKSVLARFEAGPVLQYDLMHFYRPEPLRHHIENKGTPDQVDFNSKYYSSIALPQVTCWQGISMTIRSWIKQTSKAFWLSGPVQSLLIKAKERKVDKKISCLGLLFGAALAFTALSIFVYQTVLWLLRGTWPPVALEDTPASLVRGLGRSWVGLQMLYDWLLAIPATLGLAILAFVVFWSFGIWSAKLYERQSTAKGLVATPSQTPP
jgi:uncharacterized protein (DUF2235 family)